MPRVAVQTMCCRLLETYRAGGVSLADMKDRPHTETRGVDRRQHRLEASLKELSECGYILLSLLVFTFWDV
jgi:hypothetical protein